jgi:hypothetical protein
MGRLLFGFRRKNERAEGWLRGPAESAAMADGGDPAAEQGGTPQ